MLGVVQTADGLPLYHEVFDGNTAEVTTTINQEQADILSALTIKKPTLNTQLTFL